MASSIVISQQDLTLADKFLTAYLMDKIPDADFSEGSVVRDFVIKAIAYIFAYLERERKIARDRQSLLSLASLPAGESVDEAVDALLSNWFLERRTGSSSVLTAVLHFSQAVDVQLAPGTRFFRTSTQIFTPNILATTLIPASEMRPNVNADGTIADYTVSVSLIASKNGKAGNVVAGRFVSADPFNGFFLFAENTTTGDGGQDIESTTELLARAPTAISVRNLVNSRSIDTVLRDAYPVDAVRVIGYGDPEMIRDYSTESVSHLHMHVGGHTDTYVELAITEVLETLTIGGSFPRPDGLSNVLRDTETTPVRDFVADGVAVGDVLRINAGLPNTPREYLIVSVATDALEVQPRFPFSRATDETSDTVGYTVGNLAPSFDNVIGNGTPVLTGETSRQLVNEGRVVLTGRPHYKIKSVEVIDGSVTTILGPRVNGTPAIGEYQVLTRVPGNAQSALAVTEIIVDPFYEGLPMRVRYETLVGYDDIQAFVRNSFERVLNANPLVKGFNPVYLAMSLQFKLRPTATGTVSPAAVSVVVADYINSFDPLDTIELTGIEAAVRENFPNIGAIIYPTVLTYDLLAPDGQVYSYTTEDLVTLFPGDTFNAARLTNGADLRVPLVNASLTYDGSNQALIDAANIALAEQLADLGVSDRTVRYRANAENITITEVP